MERKKMAHAIGLIAWGYLFLYFNLNLGSLNLIPSWVGYLLMGKAIKELKEASPAMGRWVRCAFYWRPWSCGSGS